MVHSRSLGWLSLAGVLFAAPAGAQAVATPTTVEVKQEQAPFILILDGLTSANAAAVQAELAKVPTVAKATVDAASGKASLATGDGIQLDTEAAKATAVKAGVTVKSVELPAWSTETVWVVMAKGGS